MTTKNCKICKQNLLLTNFSINKGCKDGHDSRCKTCVNKINKQRRQIKRNNPAPLVLLDKDPTNILSKDWQGGKYKGTVFKRKNSNIYTARVNSETNNFDKTFNPDYYDSDNDAYNDAYNNVKIHSDLFGVTRNKYKIIHENDKPKYLIVQLSKGYVTLCDYDMLNFIKHTDLCVTKCGGNKGKYYCCYDDKKLIKVQRFHGKIIGAKDKEMVDHINRYPLDNRKCNLRLSNSSENNKNKTYISKTYFVKKDNGFEANIVYLKREKFKKECISKEFKTKDEGLKWIENESKIIDNHLQNPTSLKLRKEYETYMKTYADGWKWHDDDIDIYDNSVYVNTILLSNNKEKEEEEEEEEEEEKKEEREEEIINIKTVKNSNISKGMKKYHESEEGKKKFKLAQEKRVNTMKRKKESITSRICPSCKEEKDIKTEFTKKGDYCLICKKIKDKERYMKNKQKQLENKKEEILKNNKSKVVEKINTINPNPNLDHELLNSRPIEQHDILP